MNIDAAINIMVSEEIDIFVVQETWLDGTSLFEINGYHVFTHGLGKQTCSCGQLGVAIILSPTLYDAYTKSGSPPPITPSVPDHVSYGQFIGLCFSI